MNMKEENLIQMNRDPTSNNSQSFITYHHNYILILTAIANTNYNEAELYKWQF